MKKNNQSQLGIRSETGEIYLLTKKERILTIEILKLTLATAAGRNFLAERFGQEGIKTAADLLEEMGVQISELQGRQKKNAQLPIVSAQVNWDVVTRQIVSS